MYCNEGIRRKLIPGSKKFELLNVGVHSRFYVRISESENVFCAIIKNLKKITI